MGSSFSGEKRFVRRMAAVTMVLLAGLLLLTVTLLAGCASGTTAATTASTEASAATTVAAVQTTTTAAPTTTTTAAPTTTTTAAPTTTTTEAPTTTTTLADPKGWVRFTAGGISIALPSTFKGGTPDSAALKSRLKSVSGGKSYVSKMKKSAEEMGSEWLLTMMGKASKTRYLPEVVATRMEFFFPLSTFSDEVFSVSDEGVTAKLVSKTDTKEVWLESYPKDSSGPAGTRLWALIRSGDYLYVVTYNGTTLVYNQFKDTFSQSAERIRMTEPAAAPGGTTGGGTTTTTAKTTT